MLGHSRIGFVGADTAIHQRRYRLFRKHAEAQGVESKPIWNGRSSTHVNRAGHRAMQRLLERAGSDLPTAVVGSNDTIAAGACRALKESGLEVPGDVSVTGFDDIPLAQLVVPALTTVKQPVLELARRAIELVAGSAEERAAAPNADLLPPELIARESTRRLTA
jgi:LacI family transcriptional regulator